MQIRDLSPFTLRGVPPEARPFVNLACRGDSVTVLGELGTPEADAADGHEAAAPEGPQVATAHPLPP